jgi:hypothetical protein
MKNLPPLYGKNFTENLVIYCFESQSQIIYFGLFRDFLKQCIMLQSLSCFQKGEFKKMNLLIEGILSRDGVSTVTIGG